MKKFFLMALAATVSLFAQAQTTDAPMATLQHGDQTTVFLGRMAFRQAYAAAADSADVITLSSGYFLVPNLIEKSISIYGAGMEDDTVTGTKATVMSGDLRFKPKDITDEDGNVIPAGCRINGSHIEGIRCSGSIMFDDNNHARTEKVTIAKCNVGVIQFCTTPETVTIRQCEIGTLIGNRESDIRGVYVTNCHINTIDLYTHFNSTLHVNHCIIRKGIPNIVGLFTNNILYESPASGSTVKNNIFAFSGALTAGVQSDGSNWLNTANAGIYAAEGEDGTYAADKTFELKYPKKYIGTDGTQVGLHGGDYPWNKIPCTPRIVESAVDTHTSADGRLRVNIKVEAQTKD